MSGKTYFNKAAKTWDKMYYTTKLKTFMENLVPLFGLKSGQSVLDVGTGTGLLIPFLIKAVGPSGSITAIDYAKLMVEMCRSKYSHLSNVSIELRDVEKDELPRESFNMAICFGLFPHLKRKEKALHNINRALKSEGTLVIAHALSSEEVKAHHKKTSSAIADDTLPKDEEMKSLLTRTGFTQITIKDEPGCYLCLSIKKKYMN